MRFEETMTRDKDFKKVVRRRAQESGESYTEARRNVLEQNIDPHGHRSRLRRVDKPDLSFTVLVPEDWAEFPPQPTNNPYEVARFQHHEADARRMCLVFRHPGSTGLSPQVPARLVRTKREASRFGSRTSPLRTSTSRAGRRSEWTTTPASSISDADMYVTTSWSCATSWSSSP